MKIERRKHPRRRVKTNTVFVMDDCSERIAMVKDISFGGLQIRYTPENAICHQWSNIDIFTGSRDRLLISNMGCRSVYDVASLMENGSFSGTDVRTCGVCFEQLTDDQKMLLSDLFDSLAPTPPSVADD